MVDKTRILCIGEVLWDALPSGLYLGGAPLNVCYHLNQLGEEAKIISRVGNDRLGKEALCRIEKKKLSTDLIQEDDSLETGIVKVRLDNNGEPDYEIIEPVAWDRIELKDQMKKEINNSWAIVYGSLALRDKRSRDTVNSLLMQDTLKVFDVNLRKPFYNKEIIEQSLFAADILKLNKEELNQIIEWFSFPSDHNDAIKKIANFFICDTITVTKGGAGAVLFHKGECVHHDGFDVQVKDGVGAGDAFLAALLQGLRTGRSIYETLAFANAAGAYVTSRFGATPEYTYNTIDKLIADHRATDKIQP